MPSVLINEKDYTIYNRELATDNIVYVPGFSIKGPYDRPVLLESYSDLVRIFGDIPTDTYRPSDATSSTYAMGTSWEYAAGLLNAGFIVLFRRIVPHIISISDGVKAIESYGLGTEFMSTTTDDTAYGSGHDPANLVFNKKQFASAGIRFQIYVQSKTENSTTTNYSIDGESDLPISGDSLEKTPTKITYIIREKNGGSYGNRLKLSIKKNRAGNKLFYELSEVYRGEEVLEYNEICRIDDIALRTPWTAVNSGVIADEIAKEEKFILINKLIETINAKSEILSAEKYLTTYKLTHHGVGNPDTETTTVRRAGIIDSDCLPYDIIMDKLLFGIVASTNSVAAVFGGSGSSVSFKFGDLNNPKSGERIPNNDSLFLIKDPSNLGYYEYTPMYGSVASNKLLKVVAVYDHFHGKDYTINDIITKDDLYNEDSYYVDPDSNKITNDDLDSENSNNYDATIGEILNYYLDDIEDKVLYDVKFITKGNIPYSDADLIFRGSEESLAERTMKLCRDDRNGDCIYITEPGKGTPKTDINDLDTGALSRFKSGGASYVATYAPWAVVTLFNGYNRWMAPSYCFLLALAKSVDSGNPYYLPPAGVNRAALPEVVTTEYEIGSALLNKWQNKDYQINVNPIMKLNNYGYVIYGQRTMYDVSDSVTSYRSALQEVGVRLTTIAIKKRIYRVAIGLTFEYNNIHTWNEFKARLDPLMKEMKENGALQRYKIIMDSSTTSTDDIDDNIIRGTVKIVPGRAAEDFVISFELYRSNVIFDEEDEEIDRLKIEKLYSGK